MAYSLYEWYKNYETVGNLGWNYYYAMGFGGLSMQRKIPMVIIAIALR